MVKKENFFLMFSIFFVSAFLLFYYVSSDDLAGKASDGINECDGSDLGCMQVVSGSISRSFSSESVGGGSVVTVTLTKTLDHGESTVLVEETVPSGLIVIDSGTGVAKDNVIRWVELAVAESGTYTYTVRTPDVAGPYAFSGSYFIGGGSESVISGASQILVTSVVSIVCVSGQTESCTTGLQGVCSLGTRTCSNNNWGSCVQNIQYSTEICENGIDEDCNGADLTCATNMTQFAPNIIVQAESGANNGFTIANGYVYTSVDDMNSISYTFNVLESGQYVIDVGMLDTTSGTDSFFIGLDGFNAAGNNTYVYDSIDGTGAVSDRIRLRGPNGNSTYSQYNPMIYNLDAGLHTFTFYGRERNTKMDYLRLSTYIVGANTPPTIYISNPSNGVSYTQGTNITVTAVANDSDGIINGVVFTQSYVGSGGGGAGSRPIDTTLPFQTTVSLSDVGNYTVTATAYDNSDATATADVVIYSTSVVCTVDQTQVCDTGLLGVCSLGTRTCSNNAWGSCVQNTQSSTDICSNGIDEDCSGSDAICIQDASESISRSFSVNSVNTNTNVVVTLTKILGSGENTVLIEEYVPSGFFIVNSGNGVVSGNTIRWAELTVAESGTYTYTIRAPAISGSYSFSGEYTINGGLVTDLGGSTSLVVQNNAACYSGQTESCTTGLLGVCSLGTRTCSNNAWGSCVQNTQSSTDICGNGIDEDCSGSDLTCTNITSDSGDDGGSGGSGGSSGGNRGGSSGGAYVPTLNASNNSSNKSVVSSSSGSSSSPTGSSGSSSSSSGSGVNNVANSQSAGVGNTESNSDYLVEDDNTERPDDLSGGVFSSSPLFKFMLIGVVVIGIVLFFFLRRPVLKGMSNVSTVSNNGVNPVSPKAIEYVKSMRSRGYSDNVIKEKFKSVGWTDEHIQNLFKNLK